MSERRNRYKQLEQMATLALVGTLVLFILYWLVSANEIVWLKAILSVLIFLICGISLGYLYISQELMRKRSRWMTLGFAAIAVCLLLSLLLHFPCPDPRTMPIDDIAARIAQI